jgi:hypothetical protein
MESPLVFPHYTFSPSFLFFLSFYTKIVSKHTLRFLLLNEASVLFVITRDNTQYLLCHLVSVIYIYLVILFLNNVHIKVQNMGQYVFVYIRYTLKVLKTNVNLSDNLRLS